MRDVAARSAGEFHLARIQAHLKKLGLIEVTCAFVAERNVIVLHWPHATLAVEEAVEFPVDPRWVGQILDLLKAHASSKLERQLEKPGARNEKKPAAC